MKTALVIDAVPLAARHAILVYTSTGNYDARGYVAIHDVVPSRSGLKLGAGRPIGRAELADLIRNLDKPLEGTGFLDPRVLGIDAGGEVTWWIPPSRRLAWFRTACTGAAQETISGTVPYPALVLRTCGRGLQLFAHAGADRPSAQTVLMACPIMNVFSSALLCMGSVAQPIGKPLTTLDAWERAVFDSISTHPNPGQDMMVNYKGGLIALWADLLNRKVRNFPVKVLKPWIGNRTTWTVGQLIDGVVPTR